MYQLIYPAHGRGAWTGVGGTLSGDGISTGRYYRKPAGNSLMPGVVGHAAVDASTSVDINSFAVYMAVGAIQREVGAQVDGLFGPATAAAVQSWQIRHGLEADGIIGPASAKAMFRNLAVNSARQINSSSSLTRLVCGHIGFESSWDPGAVGYVVPRDLGLGQINGPAHPELTPEFRLTARFAVPWVANFVLDNLEAMLWNERDAIVAYNLGVGGARSWVKAGRPGEYEGTDVAGYISGVLAAVN